MRRHSLSLLLVFFVAISTVFQEVWAEDGVTENLILVGVQGPTGSFSGDEENFGMELVIKQINDQGGIHGRRLSAHGYPKFKDYVAHAKRLVEEDKVFCIYNHGGSPTALALAPYAMEKKVPYLFPHEGILTRKDWRYVFTSFPRYEDEIAVMYKYLVQTRGFKKLSIIYADNDYGRLFRNRLEEKATQLGYAVTGTQPVKNMDPADLMAEVRQLKEGTPEAVIMAIYPAQAKKTLEAKANLDWKDVLMVSAGPLTDEGYLNVPGGHAEGTIGLCYYPDPNVSQEAGVIQYRELMKRYHPGKTLNRYSLYGYVYGNLIMEGLKRAGRDLNREGFIDAMESIKNWESGGIMPPVSFSKTDHHAQKAGFIAELKGGKFVPISGWFAP
jgi:ABC-type branched-subunit amino acid transport system substrate-binding protein